MKTLGYDVSHQQYILIVFIALVDVYPPLLMCFLPPHALENLDHRVSSTPY